jgi:hypothetical protein
MWVLPEIVVQRVLQVGMTNLKANPLAFNEIFAMYLQPEMNADYGQPYVDKIRKWFCETKIPVIQGFSYNRDRLPSFSITLGSESEDESKAAIGDQYGEEVDDNVGVGVMSVMVDVGIHGDKDSDYVLYLYYIMSYIFFKEKLIAERLGVQLQTWSASDLKKDVQYQDSHVWSRWVRFKCTTENTWTREPKTRKDVEVGVHFDRAGIDDVPDDDLV